MGVFVCACLWVLVCGYVGLSWVFLSACIQVYVLHSDSMCMCVYNKYIRKCLESVCVCGVCLCVVFV